MSGQASASPDGAGGARQLRGLLAVTGALTLGCLLMAVSHAGVSVPLFARLGPSGGVVVPPVAIGFSVLTIVYGLALVGLVRRQAWAWALALVAFGVTLVGAAMPYRGAGSAIGIGLSGLGLALVLSPRVRAHMLPRPRTG